MSETTLNSIGSVLWGKRIETGRNGCGEAHGKDVIILTPDEFGYAWRQTGIFMCSETEDPILNEVKANASAPSLWQAVAEVALKKTFPGRYAGLGCSQREEAKNALAALLAERFAGKKFSDTMGWWGWTLRKDACKSSEPFPNEINLLITKSDIDTVLTGAEAKTSRGDCGLPTKIIQSLVLRQQITFTAVEEGKSYNLPPIEFLYGDEMLSSSSQPENCSYTVEKQQLPAEVTPLPVAKTVIADIDPQTEMIMKVVKSNVVSVFSKKSFSIDTPGTYTVGIICERPKLTLADIGTLVVKKAPRGAVHVGRHISMDEDNPPSGDDAALKAKKQKCTDSKGTWKADDTCACGANKKLEKDACVDDAAPAGDPVDDRQKELEKAKKKCQDEGGTWKNEKCEPKKEQPKNFCDEHPDDPKCNF